MSVIRLLAMGIRILGAYYLLTYIFWVYQFFVSFTIVEGFESGYGGLIDGYTLLMSATYLIAILIMIVFPVSLARWFVPMIVREDDTDDIQTKNILTSAFIIIGVVLLVGSITDIFYNGAWIWHIHSQEHNNYLLSQYVISLLTALIKFGIGLYLTIGMKGFRQILFKIRRIGIK